MGDRMARLLWLGGLGTTYWDVTIKHRQMLQAKIEAALQESKKDWTDAYGIDVERAVRYFEANGYL